jgi:hypothetical protein
MLSATIRCGGSDGDCARPPLHPGRCDPAADHRYPYRPYRQIHGDHVTCDRCGAWRLNEPGYVHNLEYPYTDEWTVVCDPCWVDLGGH